MGRWLAWLAAWLYRCRGRVLLAWLGSLVAGAALMALVSTPPVETELAGAAGTPADRVAHLLKDGFGVHLGATADLVAEGPIDGRQLMRDVQARVPAVVRAQELTGVHPHRLRLFHLTFDPALPVPAVQALTPGLREVARAHGSVAVTGSSAFQFDAKEASKSDSRRTEKTSLLVSLAVLLGTFGAPLAVLLPLLAGLTTLLDFNALASALHLAVNPVSKVLTTLVGMALAVDYAIFMVSRFREELRAGQPPEAALTEMLTHPGRTVAYSALVMAVSLAALLIPDVSLCRVVIANLILVVGISAFNALVLLPALLAWKPHWLDRPRKLTAWLAGLQAERLWRAFARRVVERPVVALALSVAILGALTAPVVDMKLWEPVQAIAPQDAESRLAYERLRADGWGGELMPVQLAVLAPAGHTVYEPDTIAYVHDLTAAMAADPHVGSVASLTSWRPGASKADYQHFFHILGGNGFLKRQPQLAQLVSADAHATLVQVFPRDLMHMADTDAVLTAATAYAEAHRGRELLVGGVVARVRDITHELYRHWPWLVAWVVGGIYALLLVYMRSLVLPLKAALINFLPILGAYGILVLVFQQGHAAAWLHAPVNGAVTNLVPIMLFCIVFGLSMDYEVLMLGRIAEAYQRADRDVKAAVVEGMGASGAVITGAAVILLGLFATGMSSSSPQTQEICTGITAALAIDATVVRFLLVPSVIVLLGRWNFWNPFQSSR